MNATKKELTAIVDRYFEQYKELPHEIKQTGKEDSWKIYRCTSANNNAQIATKNRMGHIEAVKWAD